MRRTGPVLMTEPRILSLDAVVLDRAGLLGSTFIVQKAIDTAA